MSEDGVGGEAEYYENFKENGEMADVEILEAHIFIFIFYSFITMSEVGGGGRSKV